jgi:hypothetical protein
MKFRTFIIFLVLLYFSHACNRTTETSWSSQPGEITKTGLPENATILYYKDMANLFPADQASRILGRKAQIQDSAFSNDDILSYKSSFTDSVGSHAMPPFGKVYFMYEEYRDDSLAHISYMKIKTANEEHGIKDLVNFGDEAYFHTDGDHFYFILARKGKRMIRMKVSTLTSFTSKTAFLEIVSSIVSKI